MGGRRIPGSHSHTSQLTANYLHTMANNLKITHLNCSVSPTQLPSQYVHGSGSITKRTGLEASVSRDSGPHDGSYDILLVRCLQKCYAHVSTTLPGPQGFRLISLQVNPTVCSKVKLWHQALPLCRAVKGSAFARGQTPRQHRSAGKASFTWTLQALPASVSAGDGDPARSPDPPSAGSKSLGLDLPAASCG